MKYILFFFLFCSVPSFSQTTVKLVGKEFVKVPAPPKTEVDCQKNATKTDRTYEGKEVWKTSKDKYFAILPSTKGGFYRRYLKLVQ